jgi:hypothetical protein
MSSNRKSRNASRSQPIVVRDNDVIKGRGVKIAQHIGNLRFRALIKQKHDPTYCEGFSSSEKKALAKEIIQHIQDLNPPGRFLKQHGENGPWVELTKTETEKKTKQALRDCNRADRTGYAKQVTAPQDVERADEERKRSGLTLQERARRQVDADAKSSRTSTRGGNTNRKPPPTPGAASRSSRRSNQGGSTTAVTADNIPDVPISTQRTEEPPIDLSFRQPLDAAAAQYSHPSWADAPSTVNATPAVRPYIDPTPVTQTPNPRNSSLYQASDHDRHHLHHHGSQPTINSHQALAYHDHDYTHRDNFTHHHSSTAQAVKPAAGFTSPMLRSPIVAQPTANNNRVVEAHDFPLLDDWTPDHHPQNLFQGEDTLDSMAASADANLSNDRIDDDFMNAFGNTTDVPDNNDLAI